MALGNDKPHSALVESLRKESRPPLQQLQVVAINTATSQQNPRSASCFLRVKLKMSTSTLTSRERKSDFWPYPFEQKTSLSEIKKKFRLHLLGVYFKVILCKQ